MRRCLLFFLLSSLRIAQTTAVRCALSPLERGKGKGQIRTSVIVWAVLSSATVSAQEASIFDSDSGTKQIASDCQFTEGPVVDGRGNLFVSDGPNNRTLQRSVAGNVSVFRNIAYKTEGTEYELERAKLDLYLPHGKKDFPTVLWFHGGSLKAGDKQGNISKTVGQRFAGEGIAVASANYRLFPQAKYPMYIEDSAAALAWLHEHIASYGGDPDNLFISGHSAGGYLAAMVSLDEQYLKEHGLSLDDLAGSIPVSGQIDSHWTVREERGVPRSVRVIDESAPLFHIRADAPPMLTFCGSNDLKGRADRNQVFADALKRAGHSDTTYKIIDGRNHGTIISRVGEPGDEVGRDMIEFVKSHARQPSSN